MVELPPGQGTCTQVSQTIGLLQAPDRTCMNLGNKGKVKCVRLTLAHGLKPMNPWGREVGLEKHTFITWTIFMTSTYSRILKVAWYRILSVFPFAQTLGDVYETKPYDLLCLVTVTIEEDQINTPTCSPGAFIQKLHK